MTKQRRVFIVGGSFMIANMFKQHNWLMASSVKDADLVQYTGGADVTPSYYGQGMHPRTYNSTDRDTKEALLFHTAVRMEKPQAGICRGGQFLNVMCGGSMWQHCDRHNLAGTHQVIDEITGEIFQATSTHHQMMNPSKDALIVAVARESSFRERCDARGTVYIASGHKDDVEVCFYEKQRALCFQPHPEGVNDTTLSKIYMNYIDTYLFNE